MIKEIWLVGRFFFPNVFAELDTEKVLVTLYVFFKPMQLKKPKATLLYFSVFLYILKCVAVLFFFFFFL